MKLKSAFAGVCMMAVWVPTQALAFAELPTIEPLRIVGVNNPNADPLFLGDGWTPQGNGYDRVGRRISSVLFDGNDIGTFYDYVYRSTADGSLLFASRFTLEVEEQNGYTLEINDLFRRGFAGYQVAVGWYDGSAGLRLQSAARTETPRTRPQIPDVFDPDAVALRTDISIEEGNPATAWYVIKTDATAFQYLGGAVSVSQAASADGFSPPLRVATFEGFAPVPIPEPGTYAMLLAGLGILGFAVRRRRA